MAFIVAVEQDDSGNGRESDEEEDGYDSMCGQHIRKKAKVLFGLNLG